MAAISNNTMYYVYGSKRRDLLLIILSIIVTIAIVVALFQIKLEVGPVATANKLMLLCSCLVQQ